jgi:hypothetical protein
MRLKRELCSRVAAVIEAPAPDHPMPMRLRDWKVAADRLWSAVPFDHAEAAQLVADIAQQDDDAELKQAAAAATPYMRAACARTADRYRKDTAQRRFGALRDALHARTAARFGQRGAEEVLTPEDRYRRMLGLPLGKRLFGPEISSAYKRAAKRAHPDAGGSQRAFLELIAARDALMKRV